ncbi:cobalamin biosynthesis protein CobD [Pseudaminobacter sp. 19-2017]|uniref:Cobalamin biosynthesis protein CobD n=1 Tax=Pseudaminobacter soli (ex Zhang et al. 2022) TaxID=2831468 RepID=A0A942I6F4_9HYPH|nr:adenosylcobinamide-phosphate synthase CbiB [Pseudaminobacter soli]MBS3647255.1 cobalamin biosynthesis protein CobD [Pseudaminobacter soli]
MSAPLTLLSLIIELALGYPDRLVRAIGHPVIWIGHLISWLDRSLNRATVSDTSRRILGCVALVLLVGIPALIAFGIEALLLNLSFGIVIVALLASSLIAQRSLAEHVRAVADAFDSGGLSAGRAAVSRIVGRDPERLDEAGVCRAAIESLAENFSDGVVAPTFWLLVGGLPGVVAYKAANTADSMIGHKTPRHQAFGWAAARFDDLINLPASRLTAPLVIAAACFVPGASPSNAWRAVLRDARHHRSPNAGWPESAVAGALGLALAGPRVYDGVTVEDAVMGQGGRREAKPSDIRAALKLYWVADILMIGLTAVIAVLVLLVW